MTRDRDYWMDIPKMAANETELQTAMRGIIEWAKGNRGRKDINPYAVPEVKTALKALWNSLE